MSESSSSGDLDHSKTHRAKFFQRWPKLKDVYEEFFERKGDVIDYSKETKIKETLSKEIETKLHVVWDEDAPSKNFRSSFNESLYDKFSKARDKDDERLVFLLLDELLSYYLNNSKTPLVIKYYAMRAFQELRQSHLSEMHTEEPGAVKKSWSGKPVSKEFICCKDDDVKWFEKEITFISAFFNQELLTLASFIAWKLDDLAEQVLDLIRQKNHANPLLSVTKEELRKWHSHGFSSNKFADEATREILDCQCELFKGLGFEVDRRDEKDLMDMYEVLETKKGNWQVVFAIFMGVAHRLGVYCRFLSTRRNHDHYDSDLGWESVERNDNDDKTSKEKYFALNIFECKKSQHEEVVCHAHPAPEVFEATVVYRRIPDVIFGELREELINIIDDQDMVRHKYRLSDSSDEDERFGQYNRCEDFDDDSNEEKSSEEDEGPQYDSFGFEKSNYGIVKKRESDTIAIHEGKLLEKLAAIVKRTQTFETRQRLWNQERENKKLREEIAALRNQNKKN